MKIAICVFCLACLCGCDNSFRQIDFPVVPKQLEDCSFFYFLEDAFEAGRNSVLGGLSCTSYSTIVSNLDREAREAKIRLAGVLCLLRDSEVISHSKMLQLADMTNIEIAKAIDALKDNGEEESE